MIGNYLPPGIIVASLHSDGCSMPLRKLLLRLMLASLAFSALAGILAVLTAGQEVVWRVTSTGLLAAILLCRSSLFRVRCNPCRGHGNVDCFPGVSLRSTPG